MRATLLVLCLAAGSFAIPTDYPAPPGGWDSVKYPKGTGENLHEYPPPPGGWESVDYPKGTGENLHEYPPPPGGWESVDYGKGSGSCPPAPYSPIAFTSTYHVVATPDQVVNGTSPAVFTGGLKGAIAYFGLGINSKLDLICWNITLIGFQGEYASPARTATHVHQGRKGATGPPRITFPNPVGDGHERISVGCQQGPFTTGILTNGVDTGNGFMLKSIEADPSNFFADIHSTLAVPGAVRGQLG